MTESQWYKNCVSVFYEKKEKSTQKSVARHCWEKNTRGSSKRTAWRNFTAGKQWLRDVWQNNFTNVRRSVEERWWECSKRGIRVAEKAAGAVETRLRSTVSWIQKWCWRRSERLVAGNRLLCTIVAREGLVYQEHHQTIDNTAGDRNLRAVKNRHPKIRH